MYQTEYDDFKKTIADLCVAVNRPFNDDLARVFWEDLKGAHLSSVRERAKYLRACGKTRFTSNDLRPEPGPAPTPSTYTPPPNFDKFHTFGQRCLMKFLLAAPGEVSAVQLMALVEIKNRIVQQHCAAGDQGDAKDWAEVMLSAFGKALA